MHEFDCPNCKISHDVLPVSLKGPFPCHGCGCLLSVEGNNLVVAKVSGESSKSTVLISSGDIEQISSQNDTVGSMVIECPGCQGRIRVPKNKGGANANCPRCRVNFAIPIAPDKKSIEIAKILRNDNLFVPIDQLSQLNTQKIFCPKCGLSSDLPIGSLTKMLECKGCQNRFIPDAMASSNQLIPVSSFNFENDDDSVFQLNKKKRTSGFCCPYCGSNSPIILRREISTAGWVTFVVLLSTLFGIFICWIGFLIREDKRYCSHCGIKLGG